MLCSAVCASTAVMKRKCHSSKLVKIILYYIIVLGTAECTVTDQSATQITCDLGASVPGAAAVQVTVTGSGNSDSDTEFTYEFDPTSASPDTGWLILLQIN